MLPFLRPQICRCLWIRPFSYDKMKLKSLMGFEKGAVNVDVSEKNRLSEILIALIRNLEADGQDWVDLARVGAPLAAAGVNYKAFGFSKLRPFLEQFQDVLDFRSETTEEKPPVFYARPKELTDAVPKACTAQKPPFEQGKSPLMALGYVPNLEKALENLSRKVAFDRDALERRMKEAYDQGELLYYEYDENGDPVQRPAFSRRTMCFALPTGLQDSDGAALYVQYSRKTQGWMGIYFNTEKQIFDRLNSYRIGALSFWNYAAANDFIVRLKERLLPGESWKYAKPAPNPLRKKTEYEILESYLRTVLFALLDENDRPESLNYGKIKFSQDHKYALFNTGLLSNYATDIRIVGEAYGRIDSESGTFLISNISNPEIVTGGKSTLARKGFDASAAEVDMVSFFKDVSQIVYDATVDVDTDNLEKLHHCIDEGIQRNRFPRDCVEQYRRGDLVGLTNKFKSAIEQAVKIARRNYKYVVPQYRVSAKGNKIQFLMPIYMPKDSFGGAPNFEKSPDFVLVLSESVLGKQKFYIPETVLELAWAYNNARVICKPDDTWLNPEKIEDIGEEEDFLSMD